MDKGPEQWRLQELVEEESRRERDGGLRQCFTEMLSAAVRANHPGHEHLQAEELLPYQTDLLTLPYVVGMMIRMVRPTTDYLSGEKPISITYLEKELGNVRTGSANVMSVFYSLFADELLFYCGWFPEKLERKHKKKNKIRPSFYHEMGELSYSRAATESLKACKRKDATEYGALSWRFRDWTQHILSVREESRFRGILNGVEVPDLSSFEPESLAKIFPALEKRYLLH